MPPIKKSNPRKPKNRLFSWLGRCFLIGLILSLCLTIAALLGVLGLYVHIEPQLPNIDSLREAKYQTPLGVYSRDGKLIAQFGEKKRTPITFGEAPEKLVQAVLSAEDDRFFDHPGVDYQGLLRAAFKFLRTGHKRQGGSTITMQVARNFFLSSEKTFLRKFKEIFLALKIEKELGKQDILELYLNKIYLGHHAYGVAAAAQAYFGKSLDELNVSQFALLAGLPKAPSSYNPFTSPEKALGRRNFVLQRMHTLGFIDDQELQTALAEPIEVEQPPSAIELNAPYIAEMVRNQIVELYGEEAYDNGYKVYTTIDSHLQEVAEKSLRLALHEYDERHGYRGPIEHLNQPTPAQIAAKLKTMEKIGDTRAGVVIAVENQSARIQLGKSNVVELPWDGMKWARPLQPNQQLGAAPHTVKDILRVGDVVRMRPSGEHAWRLTQVPAVEGSLVALNPEDGAVVALEGGFDFFHSKYNRAIQAHRQPGSSFKPIAYAAALEQGYTPASILSDTPFVYVDPWQQTEWRPHNYTGKFLGPIRLREALIHSTNLASVRLLNDIGIDTVIEAATRFGLPKEQLPTGLSLVLGSGSATPMQMARAYAVFANGGFLIDPHFIERVESLEGAVLFQASPKTVCRDCDPANSADKYAPRILSPSVHFLMNSLLQDVILRGTARKALELKRGDIAGKTGTTNEQKDAWFNGYSPAIAAVSWMGFDASLPLGKGETGGHAALPMWINFMREALRDKPEQQFPQPEDIVSVKIDPDTGLRTEPNDPDAIAELFQRDNLPGTKTEEDQENGEARPDTPAEPGMENLF